MEGVQLRPLLGHHPCFAGVPSGQFPAHKFMSSVMVSGQLKKKTCLMFFLLVQWFEEENTVFYSVSGRDQFCSQGQ